LNVSAKLLALLVGSAVIAGFAEAAVLALVAYSAVALSTGAHTVDLTLTGIDVGRAGIPMLLGIGVALVVVRLATQEVGAYLPARVGANLQFTMREELWTSFLGASWEAQGGEREGALQEVLTVQVPRATEAFLYAASGVAAAVTFTALVVSSLLLNVAVAALAILAAGVLFLGLRPLTGLARRFSRQLTQDNAEYASGVSEGVRLAKEIRVFGVGDAHRARTSWLLDRVRHSFFRGQWTTRNIIPLYQAAALLIILGGLAALYVSGTARIAALGAVVLLLIRALNYSQTAQAAYHQFHEVLPFVDSVKSAREKYAQVREPDGDMELPSVGTIEARDISFAYIAGATYCATSRSPSLRARRSGSSGPPAPASRPCWIWCYGSGWRETAKCWSMVFRSNGSRTLTGRAA
jgi:ATP-binding cassette subfamily B protein